MLKVKKRTFSENFGETEPTCCTPFSPAFNNDVVQQQQQPPAKRTRRENEFTWKQPKRESPFPEPEKVGDNDINKSIPMKKKKKNKGKVYTEEEVKNIVEEAVRQREEELRDEYDRILQDRLEDQYWSFVKFNEDYISRNYKPTKKNLINIKLKFYNTIKLYHLMVKIQWRNGDCYIGDLQGGLMHGEGIFKRANEGVYKGEFCCNKMHGRGTYTYNDGGGVYRGEFRNNKRHGEGRLDHSDGSIYIGQWRNDVKHGWGSETLPDGACYVGQFHDGMYNGHGTYIFADGRAYTGEMFHGVPHGRGEIFFRDGTRYEGAVKMGLMHGYGTLWLPNRDVIEGAFESNRSISNLGEDSSCSGNSNSTSA